MTRRGFLHFTSAALSAQTLAWANPRRDSRASPGQAAAAAQTQTGTAGVPASYPSFAPELIQKIVTVSHFSLDKVKEIVDPHPQLVKASWDWGFGDWETPLGAACHMGRKDIAEYLLAQGATPTIFSAVLFGELDLVKQMVERHAGLQRVGGPHSISLLAHARMGGPGAQSVLAYLTSLGDADMAAPAALSEKETQLACGTYQLGNDSSSSVEVSSDMHAYANIPMYTYAPQLNWKRTGTMARPLFHRGGMTFYPAGAPSVQVKFEQTADRMLMTMTDGGEVLTASRGLHV